MIAFSILCFMSLYIPLTRGEFGPFLVGLLFSLFLLVLGWRIKENLEEPRKRIRALFKSYFPRCPICKSGRGYIVRGLLPTSQYVRCKNCGAEWTSNDFFGDRGLKFLKLWKPPQKPRTYAEFISQSVLKSRRTYPTELWQAMMNNEEVPLREERLSLLTKIKTMRSNDLVSSNKWCFVMCLGTSAILTTIGFFWFTLTIENGYTLFLTIFFTMFLLLIEIRRFG